MSSKKNKNKSNNGAKKTTFSDPKVQGSEKSMSQETAQTPTQTPQQEELNSPVPASEDPAQSATQTPQREEPKSAKKAKMSFVEKIFRGFGYVKEPLYRSKVDANYVLKRELDNLNEKVKADYVLKKDYIHKDDVQKSISEMIAKLTENLDMGEDFTSLSLEDKLARIRERVMELNATVESSTVKVEEPHEDVHSDVSSEQGNELDNLEEQKIEPETTQNELEDNAKLKDEVADLKQKLADAKALAGEKSAKIEELNGQLDAAKTETNDINNKLANAERRASSAETKIQSAEDKARAAEQAAQEAKAAVQVAEQAVLEAKADAETARNELENSEVGKLKETISDLNNQLEESNHNLEVANAAAERTLEEAKAAANQVLEKANAKISDLEGDIDAKAAEIEEKNCLIEAKTKEIEAANKLNGKLRGQLKDNEAEIAQLKIQGETDRKEIENKTTKLNEAIDSISKQRDEISEKELTITNLQQERDDKIAEIETLNGYIRTLEGEKQKLNDEKAAAEEATRVKADFIKSERDNYAAKVMKIVDELCTMTKGDFIVSCDDESERQCKTLAEKVWRPLIDLKDELAEADKPEFGTVDMLVEAWYKVIKAHLDEPSELTRIAQWYAYSLVPFMGDSERTEGIRINRSKMKSIYVLAGELLSMVGIRFDLPSLYVENLEDASDYENVTGQRQLNIEYMCPTARNHKEKIDLSDTESIIIDVVEVGYVDNKGNKKSSQVII